MCGKCNCLLPPLIPPQEIASHWFWTNFLLRGFDAESRDHYGTIESLGKRKGFDLSKYKIDKRTLLRNCVEPEVAKHILDLAINPIEIQKKLL